MYKKCFIQLLKWRKKRLEIPKKTKKDFFLGCMRRKKKRVKTAPAPCDPGSKVYTSFPSTNLWVIVALHNKKKRKEKNEEREKSQPFATCKAINLRLCVSLSLSLATLLRPIWILAFLIQFFPVSFARSLCLRLKRAAALAAKFGEIFRGEWGKSIFWGRSINRAWLFFWTLGFHRSRSDIWSGVGVVIFTLFFPHLF